MFGTSDKMIGLEKVNVNVLYYANSEASRDNSCVAKKTSMNKELYKNILQEQLLPNIPGAIWRCALRTLLYFVKTEPSSKN